jgi:hypothetical protein
MTVKVFEALVIAGLAFVQNTSFSIVSRSRNRSSLTYHAIASVFSNGIYFLVLKEMLSKDLAWHLLPGYITGTVLGSIFGAKVSMFIERMIGASADGHLEKKDGQRTNSCCND